jgi:hypothetical protein
MTAAAGVPTTQILFFDEFRRLARIRHTGQIRQAWPDPEMNVSDGTDLQSHDGAMAGVRRSSAKDETFPSE